MTYLTRHESVDGLRWALDDRRLGRAFTLARLLGGPSVENEVSPSAALGTGA